jgi:uncharacterized membrane protein YagU involved in acid resistance
VPAVVRLADSLHETKALPRPRTLIGAAIAGVVAGVTITACIAVMNLAVLHVPGFTLRALFAFDASVLVGKVAYTGDSWVALGVGLHFLVAIGWALGYAFVAERLPQLTSRPIISGAFFGLIIYFAMQLVIVAANLYHIPTPAELGTALLAHLGFYGIPVAVIVARTQPRA